jgi:hypothetical protein
LAKAAALGATLTAVAIAGSLEACITTPPPDLPDASARPTILHDSVTPPVDETLTEWPPGGEFYVPVQLNDPNEEFCWVVFVDYNPYGLNTTGLLSPGKQCEVASPSQFDAGVVGIPVIVSGVDTTVCHQVQFLVAENFEIDNHTPVTPPGGDDVFWNYDPGGAPCPLYDAGASADGAFPDAASGAFPVTPQTPEGGAGDDSGSP